MCKTARFVMIALFGSGLIAFAEPLSSSVDGSFWQLNTQTIKEATITGNIRHDDGSFTIDGESKLSLPSSVLGDQKDYTIEFEVKCPDKMTTGHGIVLCSNQDNQTKSGIQLRYYPPGYNAFWLQINGYQSEEKRNALGQGFTKLNLVVNDKQLMLFRDGMLLASCGNSINSSSMPLTFGGAINARNMPEAYSIRNVKIYDSAITPSGFDPSLVHMRSYSGPGYRIDRVQVEDPALPRILVVGDSISMGYRRFISEHYQGRAYVDYWIGGSWIGGPKTILGQDAIQKKAWKEVMNLQGPYDAITWNPMGLHVWNPDHAPHRSPDDKMAEMFTELITFIIANKPVTTNLIWVTTTPFFHRGRKGDDIGEIDMERSRFVARYNSLTTDIIRKHEIPVVDLWGFGEQNLNKISTDGVHWSSEASKMMSKLLITEIDQVLTNR